MLLISVVLVVVTVLIVLWLNAQEISWVQKILDWFPAILFAYVIPAIFTHSTGLDLSTLEIHGWSRNLIIPLAIISVMSALSFKQLKLIGWKPIFLFVSGSMVIAIMAPLLVLFLKMGGSGIGDQIMDEGLWKGLVPIVGGWIGGSTSQLVLKELVDCPESLFLAILVLDNVLVNIWTILMFQFIKRSDQINELFKIKADRIQEIDNPFGSISTTKSKIITSLSVLGMVLLATFFIKSFLWLVVFLSVAGLLIGNFIPKWDHTFVLKIGGILIVTIMAILGLKLNFDNVALPGYLILFVIVWLLIHYLFMLVVAVLLRVHIAWVPIASMANLGGISTAPAVTAAYEKKWMPHAILLAILSMVTGTAWGMFTIYLFESLL